MTLRSTSKFGLAVLTAASLSGAALAQEAGTTMGTSMDPATDTDAPLSSSQLSDTTGAAGSGIADSGPAGSLTTADLAAEAPETYGQAISSLRNADLSMADPEAVSEATEAELTRVSELKGRANEGAVALDDALAEAGPELEALRSLLAENETLSGMLEDEGIEPDDVIGIFASGNGSLELLIDDRA